MSPKKKITPKNVRNNARNQTSFPGLKKQYNLKTRQDQLDMDYIGKLSDKDKEWMNRFIEEEVNANFNHGGKVLNKTKKQKKACYDKNNARNRCIYTREKAAGKLMLNGNFNSYVESTELSAMDAKELVENFNNLKNTLNRGNKRKNSTKKKD